MSAKAARNFPLLARMGFFRWASLRQLFVCLAFFGFVEIVGAESSLPLETAEDRFPLLETILRESASKSPRMVEEYLRIDEAKAGSEIAFAASRPSLSASFRYLGRIEDRSDFSGTRSYYDPQATVLGRQPLYHWGALRARREGGRLGFDLAKRNREQIYQALLLDIRASFLDLAVRQKRIELAKVRLQFLDEERQAGIRRFQRGEATEEELQDMDLTFETAGIQLERERHEFEFAIESFLQLSGYAPVGRDWVPKGIPELKPVQRTELDDLTGNSLWSEISELRIQRAEKELEIESARQKPKLDLILGISQDQLALSDRSDVGRVVYFGGIELTWNLFDGFETRGRKEGAIARKNLEKRRYDREKEEEELERERLKESLLWSAREVMIEEKRLELAHRDFVQKESDQKEGILSSVEVAAARVALLERELAATEQRATQLMLASELLSATGLDPAIGFLK